MAATKSTGTKSSKKSAVQKTVARKSGASRNVKLASSKRSKASHAIAAKTPVARDALLRVAAEPRLSVGERLGLRSSDDPLDLSSSVALVVDQETNEILLSKNDAAILPIASLTKLMTGLVLAEANLPMDEQITITQDDVDTYKGSRSRLAVGTTLSRGEMMHLALMSSENRAAHALGRTYPSGLQQFVRLMNAKAKQLGMGDTRYVEPTGLSSLNQSSARDLVTLVSAAYEHPILRNLSTSPSYQLDVGQRTLQYNNSNRLIRNPDWDIGLQKTGYISEAGRCLVMQAKVAGRKLIMVFLDSAGKRSRSQDAERVRRWVEAQDFVPTTHRPQG
ncbi:serine hydrolase [Hydrogenophaga sp.]|uniref:serine hydrolase n=1 Tax=Hydrogenophaga sp. TaxID=1904254 RepID=UPI0035698971